MKYLWNESYDFCCCIFADFQINDPVYRTTLPISFSKEGLNIWNRYLEGTKVHLLFFHNLSLPSTAHMSLLSVPHIRTGQKRATNRVIHFIKKRVILILCLGRNNRCNIGAPFGCCFVENSVLPETKAKKMRLFSSPYEMGGCAAGRGRNRGSVFFCFTHHTHIKSVSPKKHGSNQ